MWDAIKEKSEMLSKLGDFWYKVVAEEEVPLIHKLCHLPLQSRVRQQLNHITSAVLSGGYSVDNFLVLRFSDSDVDWNGQKIALQRQHVADRTPSGETSNSRLLDVTIPNHTLLQTTGGKQVAENYEAVAFQLNGDAIALAQNQQPSFTLTINPDIKVTSIQLETGERLYEHIDFASQFGKLTFLRNPITLFPKMRVYARSCVRRYRNLYCYPCGVDVYGPIDRILQYERKSQSARSLYLASAQAAGFPVVRKNCRILSVSPLLDGVSYSTTDGRYDAPFPHTHLNVKDELYADMIIGGDELYTLTLPDDATPKNIDQISLDFALPVKNLTASNKIIQVLNSSNRFRPQFDGPSEDLATYHSWLERFDGKYDYTQYLPKSMNAITLVRNYLCRHRCFIARINGLQMPSDMYLRLIAFLRRELPLGSVLTTASLRATISETNPVNV